jgi:SAM-dependent methyltransferase
VSVRETEIRPDHLRAGQVERFAADIARLLARRAEFVRVGCPACGSQRSTPTMTKYELTYESCGECGTMFVNPRPAPHVLEWYYANSENYTYWNRYIFPASETARREKIFKPRVARLGEICARHGVARRALLEVGAGFGTFCEEVIRAGLFDRVLAVEPTPDLATTCRKRGLEVIEAPIEHVTLPEGSVDVVATFEVIEHLFSPRDFVVGCARVLASGGLLVVTCPNVMGFDVAVLGNVSDTIDVEHLNYFHPASLGRLLESCGLEVLETSTPGQLDAELVRKKIQAGEFELRGQPFLQRVLVDEWERLGPPFQAFLAEHGLSSHMWVVARRW